MTGAFFLAAGSQLALMTQTNAQRARLLPQRTFGPLHQFRKFDDRRAGFGMCLEQLHIVLRILFALALRLLRHFMLSRVSVRPRSSTPNSLIKRTAVNNCDIAAEQARRRQ